MLKCCITSAIDLLSDGLGFIIFTFNYIQFILQLLLISNMEIINNLYMILFLFRFNGHIETVNNVVVI